MILLCFLLGKDLIDTLLLYYETRGTCLLIAEEEEEEDFVLFSDVTSAHVCARRHLTNIQVKS